MGPTAQTNLSAFHGTRIGSPSIPSYTYSPPESEPRLPIPVPTTPTRNCLNVAEAALIPSPWTSTPMGAGVPTLLRCSEVTEMSPCEPIGTTTEVTQQAWF
jgi:hypothetical protein